MKDFVYISLIIAFGRTWDVVMVDLDGAVDGAYDYGDEPSDEDRAMRDAMRAAVRALRGVKVAKGKTR